MIRENLSRLFALISTSLKEYPVADAVVASLAVILGVYLDWPVATALIFGVFIWVMLRPVATELLAKASLAALGGVALLLLAGRDDRAETMAAISYYLLAITVVVLIRERFNSNDEAE